MLFFQCGDPHFVSEFVSKSELWAIFYKRSFSISPSSGENSTPVIAGKNTEVLMYGTSKTVFIAKVTV
jgi:hypothetical protein